MDRIPRWIWVTAVGLITLSLWQLVSSLELISPILFPSPADTFFELVDTAINIAQGGHVAEALLTTTLEVVIGFLAAAALGFTLGVLVGESRIGQIALMPYLVGFNALPKVAFAPVFVAWLGFGADSKIVMAMFIAFFPMVVDTAAGLASIDRDSIMLFRSMESSRWTTLRKLKLPAALPYIFAGLKTAAVFSVVGAVVGEYLGGGGGIGELVRIASQQLRIDRVFAFIVYLGLIGLVLFGLIERLERRVVFWRTSEARDVASS